ncbi:MAG: pilus assembly protein TadG-related protein [Gammaproteobacteria bacterium]
MDKDMKRSLSHGMRSPRRQRGAVMVLVTAGLIAILGMAGLALDLGDSYLSKTRLQNALDASALSGAKTLNGPGGTTANAQADAIATFNQDPEMVSAGLTPVIQFSATLIPFAPGATEASTPPARYIRARVDSFPRDVWFAAVLGITDRAVAGTAVSGPIPLDAEPPNEVCGLAPIMMCGKKEADDTVDRNCTDGKCYGYDVGTDAAPKETVLKTHSKGAKAEDWEVGPGNFQLLDLPCEQGGGGNCVADNLARGSACVEGDSVPTEPGDKVGPVAHGFNTRFGEKKGGYDPFDPDCNCKPDTVIDSDFSGDVNNFWYSSNYKPSSPTNGFEPPIGESGRRVLTVPIGDCTGTVNGKGEVPVLAYGCFFMTRPATHAGNTQELYGQFITECDANAAVVTNPPPGCPGGGCPLFKIVLYKDPGTNDS